MPRRLWCAAAVLVWACAIVPTVGANQPSRFGLGVSVDHTSTNTLVGRASVRANAWVRDRELNDYYGATRIPAPASGTGTRTKTWVFRARDAQYAGGRWFPLAKIRTRVAFTRRNAPYAEKIWSHTDFDRYFNICLKQLREVTASGGHFYCTVNRPGQIAYRLSSRVVANYPRPWVVSRAETFETAICQPGATRVDTQSSGREDRQQRCIDGQLEYNPNEVDGCMLSPYEGYPRTQQTISRVPNAAGRLETHTITKLDCDPGSKGPDWVTQSATPLPEPVVTITAIGATTVTGTATNYYRSAERRPCGLLLWFSTAKGRSQVPLSVTWGRGTSPSDGVTDTWMATYDPIFDDTPTSVSGTPFSWCT